jgi:hypothetical protein
VIPDGGIIPIHTTPSEALVENQGFLEPVAPWLFDGGDPEANALSEGWTWQVGEQKSQPLTEVSMRQLIHMTQQFGGYRFGGMRRILNRWIYDPTVPGRTDNARFVITTPPKMSTDDKGNPIIFFNFKSRPDRSTTGMRHKGYIRFLPDKRAKYEMGNKVQVWCSCPDFRFRSSFVLSQMGASHTPTGIGSDAINAPPRQTNPLGLPFLCKHSSACVGYMSASKKDLTRVLAMRSGQGPQRWKQKRNPKAKKPEPKAPTEEPREPKDGKKPDKDIPNNAEVAAEGTED